MVKIIIALYNNDYYNLKPENLFNKRAGSNFQYYTKKRDILENMPLI